MLPHDLSELTHMHVHDEDVHRSAALTVKIGECHTGLGSQRERSKWSQLFPGEGQYSTWRIQNEIQVTINFMTIILWFTQKVWDWHLRITHIFELLFNIKQQPTATLLNRSMSTILLVIVASLCSPWTTHSLSWFSPYLKVLLYFGKCMR